MTDWPAYFDKYENIAVNRSPSGFLLCYYAIIQIVMTVGRTSSAA
ncbi:MAG: hypothetical protein ACREN6_13575 [Gemmatimonadaceae bacterium]